MLSKKMQDRMNEQIRNEFHSAYVYLSMAAWFEDANLPGFGAWFESAWRSSGCPYRAGKVSVQMKQLDDVPLDVVADAVSRLRVDELVAAFRAAFPGRSRR